MNLLTSLSWGQSDATASAGDVHIIMLCLLVITVLIVLVLIGMAIAGLKMAKAITRLEEKSEMVLGKTMPLIDKGSALFEQLRPKIVTVTDNVTEISHTAVAMSHNVMGKVEEIGATVSEWNRTAKDANLKTRAQVAHVDRMVDTALSSTEKLTHTVVHGINVPVRQAAGIVAGLKTGFETLLANFGVGGGTPAATSARRPVSTARSTSAANTSDVDARTREYRDLGMRGPGDLGL